MKRLVALLTRAVIGALLLVALSANVARADTAPQPEPGASPTTQTLPEDPGIGYAGGTLPEDPGIQ